MKRALDKKQVVVKFYNPRDFTTNKHKKVDDTPYGGGPGMVMMVDPIIRAYKKARGHSIKKKFKTILLTPGGETFSTPFAKKVVNNYSDVIIICGRYEGIDTRVRKILRATEVSIGNYVLTGGELAAMVLMDSMTRQVPEVLGNKSSLEENRTSSHEMYTKPSVYEYQGKKYKVPEVLTSGNHERIKEWRKER